MILGKVNFVKHQAATLGGESNVCYTPSVVSILMAELYTLFQPDDSFEEGELVCNLLQLPAAEAFNTILYAMNLPEPNGFNEDEDGIANQRLRYVKKEVLTALMDERFVPFLLSLFEGDAVGQGALVATLINLITFEGIDELSPEDVIDTPEVYLRAVAVRIGLNLIVPSEDDPKTTRPLSGAVKYIADLAKQKVWNSDFRQQLFWYLEAGEKKSLAEKLLNFKQVIFVPANGSIDVPELRLIRDKFPDFPDTVIRQVFARAKRLINSLQPQEVTEDGVLHFRAMLDINEFKHIEKMLLGMRAERQNYRIMSGTSPLGNLPHQVRDDNVFRQHVNANVGEATDLNSMYYPDLSEAELVEIARLEEVIAELTDQSNYQLQTYSTLYPLGDFEMENDFMAQLNTAVSEINQIFKNSKRIDTTRFMIDIPESLLFKVNAFPYATWRFIMNNLEHRYRLIGSIWAFVALYGCSTFVPARGEYPGSYLYKGGTLVTAIATVLFHLFTIAQETRGNVQTRAYNYQVKNQPKQSSEYENGQWENDQRWL